LSNIRRILALDPAASTGYAVMILDKDNDSASIIEYGFINVDVKSEFQGDHCINLMNQVSNLIDKYSIDEACIEDYFFSQRFASGSNVNAAYRTALHILLRQKNLPYTILNISAWKSFVAGRSVPTKEQKKKWGKTLANKLYIQQALWEKWGFRFPNHSLSEKTGKPISFRYDVVDVVAQSVYFAGLLNGVKKIYLNVQTPPDVIFNKKNNNKQFIYPEVNNVKTNSK
jgi:Holliday junction resolvasome RuvABC endonuclease subunit